MSQREYFPIRVEILSIAEAKSLIIDNAALIIAEQIDWEKYMMMKVDKEEVNRLAVALITVGLRQSPFVFPITPVDLSKSEEKEIFDSVPSYLRYPDKEPYGVIMQAQSLSDRDATLIRDYMIVKITELIPPLLFGAGHEFNLPDFMISALTRDMLRDLVMNNHFYMSAFSNMMEDLYNPDRPPTFPIRSGRELKPN